MPEQRLLVAVVDDDESVRESLPDLLREIGYTAMAFASAEQFLASDRIAGTGCMVVDIGLPGMSGPQLQQALIGRGHLIPTIFITARSRQSIPVELRHGGIRCLFKPFGGQALQTALQSALGEI